MSSAVSPEALMEAYAERTGITGPRPQRRYLWTDAFAVCNFLGLGRLDLAKVLVDRVHHELGRHRADDSRTGWISGLPDPDGEAHPTLGGLRIGKPLPERPAGEPADERLEWDRDGQYFHYLTKWMHALDRVARTTGDGLVSRWACELADTAYRRFVHDGRGAKTMYWKMSIDLMRPQVSSMGHHDPLDGYITYLQLAATARRLETRGPDLGDAIVGFRAMLEPSGLATADPLGLGGLLVDASRLQQLDRDHELRMAILAGAQVGLAHYLQSPALRRPAEHRLAFRELGLAIGLSTVADMPELSQLASLREEIAAFWSAPAHRDVETYREHEDINDVMLSTCLSPAGFSNLG